MFPSYTKDMENMDQKNSTFSQCDVALIKDKTCLFQSVTLPYFLMTESKILMFEKFMHRYKFSLCFK